VRNEQATRSGAAPGGGATAAHTAHSQQLHSTALATSERSLSHAHCSLPFITHCHPYALRDGEREGGGERERVGGGTGTEGGKRCCLCACSSQQGYARVGRAAADEAGTGQRKVQGIPTPRLCEKMLLASHFFPPRAGSPSPGLFCFAVAEAAARTGGADTLQRGGVRPPLQCRVCHRRSRNRGPSDRAIRRPG